ncbi:MAG: VOC family protein [Nevskiaceae bacterium]|jgi:catechol 2,3-dioxygenase-like lactoylglutathione lyase family enzyme|nr:VOC family protein [Nevskiaceae bacterium]
MAIFTHVVVGTNDLAKARQFYDAALGALGVKFIAPMGDHGLLYGADHPEFLVTKPANGKPASFANGGTIGFAAPSRAAVHEFHKAGLANGGTDEGEPGPRSFAPTAYAAYLRDPDGNKICTYCFLPA